MPFAPGLCMLNDEARGVHIPEYKTGEITQRAPSVVGGEGLPGTAGLERVPRRSPLVDRGLGCNLHGAQAS